MAKEVILISSRQLIASQVRCLRYSKGMDAHNSKAKFRNFVPRRSCFSEPLCPHVHMDIRVSLTYNILASYGAKQLFTENSWKIYIFCFNFRHTYTSTVFTSHLIFRYNSLIRAVYGQLSLFLINFEMKIWSCMLWEFRETIKYANMRQLGQERERDWERLNSQ